MSSFGDAKGDRSVLAVVYTDEEGDYYLHRVEYIKTDKKEDDQATAQCQIVANIARELYLPSLTIESNGLGKFLPAILRNVMAAAKVPCAVAERANTVPKDERILSAFDAPLAAGKIHMHASVLETPFAAEMQDWRPGKKSARDDGLDAAAGALSAQPIRLKRIYGTGAQGWAKTSKFHTANTEFDV